MQRIIFVSLIFSFCFLLINSSFSQDSLRNHSDNLITQQDTLKIQQDSLTKKRERGFRKNSDLAAIFSDSAKLTSSDYQIRIEKNYAILSLIKNKSDLGPGIRNIQGKLADSDSALLVLKENILNNSQALGLRNLQMFRSLLNDIHKDIAKQSHLLDSAEATLNSLKNELKVMMKDTVIRSLMRDSVNRKLFAPQLKEMREAWRSGTSRLKESITLINLLQTHNSANAVITSTLLEKVNNLLLTSFSRVFNKEFNYLWEPLPHQSLNQLRQSYEKARIGERKALNYYFKDSLNNRLFLLVIGLIFGIWLYRNIYRLKTSEALDKIQYLEIEYLYPHFIASSFVLIFTLAPFFDLDAPSVYIESMQFLLILTLTFICFKKWPRNLFIYWLAMVVLYICFSFTQYILLPGLIQRFGLILLNVLSVIFGSLFLRGLKNHLQLRGFLKFVIILHNIMNILAILFNVFGRFSLSQILGNTAIFSFTQAIGLAVFSKIFIEAILLQIETSRIRQGFKTNFDFHAVIKDFRGLVMLLVVLLWIIVFTTNLNIYNTTKDAIAVLMTKQRAIGSASFTLGGVVLFFFIIWVAHLLQKYVGYFFGDTGNEDIQNKNQRSRMLIARLVVLCAGYLLAVTASGLPVDKITIVLGALGVGIGLGLQNIVTNFISGIILIFDRPLQVGDSIEIGDKTGKVREIGIRSSTLLTSDGAEVIIPNGDILSQHITNWTLSNTQQRLSISVTVNGNQDIEQISNAIKTITSSSSYVIASSTPKIEFVALKKDVCELKIHFWCKDVYKAEEAKSNIIFHLYKELGESNISIKG
ncbi:MAG: mechanosensitive ion channel [Sporocytophaga sp.]|nr:mechanosensitive ion channel [Sporocytophaga sp.]